MSSAKEDPVTYVICEPCINVKDTSCVEVCPVDCIHPTREEEGFEAAVQLYINPDECIDCGACESVCPVNAIFSDSEVPEKWQDFTARNAEYFK
jgi:NAD-dependent dihydropyrimidine dehydrogenase PreA subunit